MSDLLIPAMALPYKSCAGLELDFSPLLFYVQLATSGLPHLAGYENRQDEGQERPEVCRLLNQIKMFCIAQIFVFTQNNI